MTKNTQNQTEALLSNGSAKIPQSLMSCSRLEFGKDAVPLIRLEPKLGQEIPSDLQGHVFIVGPAGFEDTPYGKGVAVFNGDGMVYRLDLDKPGEVWLKTEIARTPCFYADQATRANQKYHKYRFHNWGFMRFSLPLGLRDSVNTAFLPMLFPGQETERLLVTYDAGRPYEIDTETLEVVTPVGENKEWRPTAPIKQPFPPCLSTAHPAFDAYTGEMFTINYGRSLGSLLDTIPFLDQISELPREIEQILEYFARFLSRQDFVQLLFSLYSQLLQGILAPLQSFFEKITGIEADNFLYLMRWDGTNDIERWKLVLPDGSPVKIEQSVHQIGVSKDYVVIIDTAFKVGVDQILNNPLPDAEKVEKVFRLLLTRPQFPDSNIYIVRRDQLQGGQHPTRSEKEVTVIARKVVLPLESIHFLVDYDNPNQQITLHIAHNCATDVSEWVRGYDVSAYQPPHSLPSRLDGMLAIGQMDVNRLGRYMINGETGLIVDSKVVHNSEYTFGVGLYTCREKLPSGLPPQQFEDIYWHSWGFWEELMPKFIFDLYKNYKYRMLPIEEMINLPNGKVKPVYLFRLNTKSMEFADVYQFPQGYMMSSPQFVPRKNGNGGSTDGYIFCTVLSPKSDDQDEIWIFDAADLKSGPICQLSNPFLSVGYTLHTTWLPKIAPRSASYSVDIKQDYEPVVKQKSQEIQDLFEKEIYPHFLKD